MQAGPATSGGTITTDGTSRDKRKPRPWNPAKLAAHYERGERWWRTHLPTMRRLGVLHQIGRTDWGSEQSIEDYLLGRHEGPTPRRGRRRRRAS